MATKALNKVPTATLDFTAAQDVYLTAGNTTISLLGYDGIFENLNVGQVILDMLHAHAAAKIAEQLPAISSATPGAVVRVNPDTPKDGDIKTVKPVLGPSGEVVSGEYQVYIYVNLDWRKIFPRV